MTPSMSDAYSEMVRRVTVSQDSRTHINYILEERFKLAERVDSEVKVCAVSHQSNLKFHGHSGNTC